MTSARNENYVIGNRIFSRSEKSTTNNRIKIKATYQKYMSNKVYRCTSSLSVLYSDKLYNQYVNEPFWMCYKKVKIINKTNLFFKAII